MNPQNFTLEQNGSDDILDVRDIIARIEDLRAEAEHHIATLSLPEITEDLYSELNTLLDFMKEIKGMGGDEQWEGDWYPVTLIRDSYFEEAMDDLVADCYDIDQYKLPAFMVVTFDYDMLKMDYSSADLDGTTYWMR